MKKGDRVVTSSGIYGTVQSIDDITVGLEIAEKIKVKMLRTNVAAVVSGSEEAGN